jgi:hypothetical protein
MKYISEIASSRPQNSSKKQPKGSIKAYRNYMFNDGCQGGFWRVVSTINCMKNILKVDTSGQVAGKAVQSYRGS